MIHGTDNDQPTRRNRPRVRALCCDCGTLRTTTTIGGSGDAYLFEPGDRCLIQRKCATCGTRTQHAYLLDGSRWRDATEEVERELNYPAPDCALPYRCDYPGCLQRACVQPGLAFCPAHSVEANPLYQDGRLTRREYEPGTPGDPDYFQRVWLYVKAMHPTMQPAYLYRGKPGLTIVQVHPDALVAELALWAIDHLTEAEREAIRDALDQPLDLTVPVDDRLLAGTMRTFEIPDALRVPEKAIEES